MKVIKRTLKTVLIIAAFVLLALIINEKINNKVFVREYTVSDSKIPSAFDGYKIMVISDLHEAPFAQQIIKHIYLTNPDMIAFVGDMVQLPYSDMYQVKEIADAVKNIPMYAVTGNHESQGDDLYNIVQRLWACNITPLDGYSIPIYRENTSIRLIGMPDPACDVPQETHFENMRGIVRNNMGDEDEYTVLLNHRADMYPELKDTGVDLILSGHLHGGIVRLPFVGGVIGREEHGRPLFPEYEYGYCKEGNSATMIVSGGCDKNPDKKRCFNPPEVVVVTLSAN